MQSEAFTPLGGTLTSQVFENLHVRIPPTLFYAIEVPIRVILSEKIGRPLFSTDEPLTDVQLEFIDLGLIDWRLLPGREFVFPTNGEDGYVDGSVYLGATHHTATLVRLAFDALSKEVIEANLHIDFDLTLLRPMPAGLTQSFSVNWSLSLAVDPQALDIVMAEARQQCAGQ